jgi:large subunit ribosomal protein L31
MKADIHPKYDAIQVVCACGNVFETRSTMGRETMRIDVCNACHPFYTGKHKIVDTAGRVETFMRRYTRKADGVEAKNDDKK